MSNNSATTLKKKVGFVLRGLVSKEVAIVYLMVALAIVAHQSNWWGRSYQGQAVILASLSVAVGLYVYRTCYWPGRK